MITKSDLRPLNHGELMNFLSNLRKITSKNPILTLAALNQLLGDQLDEIATLYNKERGSKFTEMLRVADRKRDLLFVAIVTILEQHQLAHPEESIREIAAHLLEVMLKHGKNLHRQNYTVQTAGMNEISSTVDKDEDLFDQFTQLHLDGYFTAMKAANEAFDELFLSRNEEASQRTDASVSELRPAAEENFRKLTTKINSYIDINEDNPAAAAPYVQLAAEINTLLDTYLGGKNRNKREEDTTEPTPPAPPATEQ